MSFASSAPYSTKPTICEGIFFKVNGLVFSFKAGIDANDKQYRKTEDVADEKTFKRHLTGKNHPKERHWKRKQQSLWHD